MHTEKNHTTHTHYLHWMLRRPTKRQCLQCAGEQTRDRTLYFPLYHLIVELCIQVYQLPIVYKMPTRVSTYLRISILLCPLAIYEELCFTPFWSSTLLISFVSVCELLSVCPQICQWQNRWLYQKISFLRILLSRFSVALLGLSRDTELISYIYEKIHAGQEQEDMERQPCDSI